MKLDEINLGDTTGTVKAKKSTTKAGIRQYLTILMELQKRFEELDRSFEADKIIPKKDRDIIRNVQRYLSPIHQVLFMEHMDDKTGEMNWESFQKKHMKGRMR